jgi:hypothetical protein
VKIEVPDNLYESLKKRADEFGMSVEEWVEWAILSREAGIRTQEVAAKLGHEKKPWPVEMIRGAIKKRLEYWDAENALEKHFGTEDSVDEFFNILGDAAAGLDVPEDADKMSEDDILSIAQDLQNAADTDYLRFDKRRDVHEASPKPQDPVS